MPDLLVLRFNRPFDKSPNTTGSASTGSWLKGAIARRLEMRAWTVFPILTAAVFVLAIPPAEARDAMNHAGTVSSSRGIATPARFVIVSNSNIGGRVIVFDHFLGRFVALDRRGFTGFSPPLASLGALGVVDGGGLAVVSAPPPSVASSAPQPTPSKSPADLPPCRETTPAGVVIERGTACSHATR
jgi:hypothetical protein